MTKQLVIGINKVNIYENRNIMCHGYFVGRLLCTATEKDLGVVIDHAEPAVQDKANHSLKLSFKFKLLILFCRIGRDDITSLIKKNSKESN